MKPWDSATPKEPQQETGVFLSDNPYLFLVNINHRDVHSRWSKFKHNKSIPQNEPASDSEREEFEQLFIAAHLKAFVNWFNTEGEAIAPDNRIRALEVINSAANRKRVDTMCAGA